MRRLDYGELMEDRYEVTKKDYDVLITNFYEDIEMYMDECGRVFNEGGIYIADIKEIREEY